MLIRFNRFNFYLLAVICSAALVAGCSTGGKKDKRVESSIRLHLELNTTESLQSTNVLVGRSTPFQVAVDRSFFLSEFQLDGARVIDTLGGFSISLQFNSDGTHILEQFTTVYRGRRVGILAEFGELRWIAAPILQSRVANGNYIFTPDTTREEAERIVSGLNRMAGLVRKGRR